MATDKAISLCVRLYLARLNKRETEFARELGYSQGQFNRRMRNVTPWKMSDIERLENAGVTVKKDVFKVGATP